MEVSRIPTQNFLQYFNEEATTSTHTNKRMHVNNKMDIIYKYEWVSVTRRIITALLSLFTVDFYKLGFNTELTDSLLLVFIYHVCFRNYNPGYSTIFQRNDTHVHSSKSIHTYTKKPSPCKRQRNNKYKFDSEIEND